MGWWCQTNNIWLNSINNACLTTDNKTYKSKGSTGYRLEPSGNQHITHANLTYLEPVIIIKVYKIKLKIWNKEALSNILHKDYME